MKNFLSCFIFLLITFFVSAQSKDEQVAIIKANRAASNAAIAKHDVDGISKFWMNDFVQVRGNGTFLVGKDTIITTWKQLFKTSPDVSYIRNPAEIIISDNDTLAWEKGRWIGIKSYSKGGNYSAMWKKINKQWMIQAEIFVALFD